MCVRCVCVCEIERERERVSCVCLCEVCNTKPQTRRCMDTTLLMVQMHDTILSYLSQEPPINSPRTC